MNYIFFAFFHVAENCHKPRTAKSTMKSNEFAYMSEKIQIKSQVLHVRMVRTNIIRKLLKTHLQRTFGLRAGQFPGIAGNAGNNGKDGKFHKSDQILDQTKRNINKLCLEKISLRKTLRIKFSVDSGFFCRFLII